MQFKWLLTILLATSTCFSREITEKPMVIIIPSYNNEKWVDKNLESVFEQEYTNYRVIYINDTSKDNTIVMVKDFLNKKEIPFNIDHEPNGEEKPFFSLIDNRERQGALANLYHAIWSCDDNEIIVTVDGDDWLYKPTVLKELNHVYTHKNVWITHGYLTPYPYGTSNYCYCKPIPNEVVKNNTFRDYHCSTHLRTFYAWLFKKNKKRGSSIPRTVFPHDMGSSDALPDV